jgi:hypothetical protein
MLYVLTGNFTATGNKTKPMIYGCEDRGTSEQLRDKKKTAYPDQKPEAIPQFLKYNPMIDNTNTSGSLSSGKPEIDNILKIL